MKITKYPTGDVFISTPEPLENVAQNISKALFIKLDKAPIGRFEEYEGYQCDAMGFTIYLKGDDLSKQRPANHNYQLTVIPSRKLVFNENMTFDEVDISSFLEWALSNIPNAKVTTQV